MFILDHRISISWKKKLVPKVITRGNFGLAKIYWCQHWMINCQAIQKTYFLKKQMIRNFWIKFTMTTIKFSFLKRKKITKSCHWENVGAAYQTKCFNLHKQGLYSTLEHKKKAWENCHHSEADYSKALSLRDRILLDKLYYQRNENSSATLQ